VTVSRLKTERTRPSVLFATGTSDFLVSEALCRAAAEKGWHLDLRMYVDGAVPKDWVGQGMIAAVCAREDLSRFVRRARVPKIYIWNGTETDAPRVAFDAYETGRLAARHFLHRGFRSFAWYSREWGTTEDLREPGFRQQIAERGDYSYFCLVWDRERGRRRDTWENRRDWLASRLVEAPRPLAILAVDDALAIEAIDTCLMAGDLIPDDVAILGVGNKGIFRASAAVSLSSIDLDNDRLIHMACDALERMMAGESVPPEVMLLPPLGIVERRSTWTITTESPQLDRALRFMLDHYDEPIRIPDIVAASAMSQAVLYREFGEAFGKPPAAVLKQIRVDRAKQMLRETQDKLVGVAQACGFEETINLYRAMKYDCGMSPSEYRESTKRLR
jgi:LacI family transcriptional regulator